VSPAVGNFDSLLLADVLKFGVSISAGSQLKFPNNLKQAVAFEKCLLDFLFII
jgi:hypothetical protein